MSVAVFLDRDGVINRKPPDGEYVRSWDQFEFLPGSIEALRHLTERGRGPVIVVTNQRGVARGLMSIEDVEDIHARMLATLAAHGARVAAIHVCPHEVGTCDCRKPALGLFLRATRDDPLLDLSASAVVGDSLSDLEAGSRLGADTFAVAPDPDELMERARRHGLRVAAAATSLLDLVRTGSLDRPTADSPAAAVAAPARGGAN